jgi:hypothetical protein
MSNIAAVYFPLSSSTRDARVFVTIAVDAPRIVPIHVVVPTQNGTQVMDIGQYFTYGKIPSIEDIHPRTLSVE